ncbi:acyl-CoA-like ligand-binding transcription factor [Nocardia anaemiae]|uniref:acyl-CoA-like ligand-binding transcription factor n=1 Tax=Nocardia anaemiae TaxID=263910 RepID=UPI0007A4CCC1|nr:hypothetical protein [Nocardia anaemiae]
MDMLFTAEQEAIAGLCAASACPADQPVTDAVRCVVVDFNRFDPEHVPWHRRRMELILKVPALHAHSTLRYREWRDVVADFAATRLGVAADELLPQTVAYSALGVAVASYEYWLAHPHEVLCEVLDRALHGLSKGLV